MSKNGTHILYRILNVWFAFIALLLCSSYLPNWNTMSYHGWLNEAAYFLLFIISVSIFLKEGNNRDIYFNFSVFFLLHSFSFLNIFIGDEALFGNAYISYYFFAYKKIILSFCFNFIIIYVVLKYLFSNKKPWVIYILTFVILLPIFLSRFFPYISNHRFIFTFRDPLSLLIDLSQRMFLAHIISILFVGLYSYLLYKNDRILGTYINLIMASSFVFLVTELVTLLSQIYGLQIFSASQYVLSLNLIFLGLIFFKKLFFLCSEYGQFYEALINKKIIMGKVKIKRYRNEINAQMLRFLLFYIYHRRNYLLMLCLLTTISLAYFRFPTYFTINIIVLVICSLILFWFVNSLYKRRAKNKYTLP